MLGGNRLGIIYVDLNRKCRAGTAETGNFLTADIQRGGEAPEGDRNATKPVAPVGPEVREARLPWLTGEGGNPASSHRFGAKLTRVIKAASG